MKKLFAVLAAVVLFATAVQAQTNVATNTFTVAPALREPTPQLKGWEVTLGGVGLTAGDQIGNQWNWGGEIGLFRNIPLNERFSTDVGLRQTIGYGTVGNTPWSRTSTVDAPCSTGTTTVTQSGTTPKDGWMFRTEAAWDLNVKLFKPVTFFVGPDIGFNYGNISPTWTFGPEAGFKVALSERWEIITRVNYDWNLSGSQDGFRVQGGLGFKF